MKIEDDERGREKLRCAQGLNLWLNNSREVNDVIFKGYWKGKSRGGKQLRLMQFLRNMSIGVIGSFLFKEWKNVDSLVRPCVKVYVLACHVYLGGDGLRS
ncbi:hypothetical protein YC2023_116776 [Brassica napus]